jgi:hypothetical protein
MEANIEKIVAEFATNIQYNITNITNTIKTVKDKIQILRDIYGDLIEKNNHKQIFLFCLESFNFQNKTLLYESDHLHKTFIMLLNRTYRDYYKLYNIILKLFDEYKLENKIQKKHPEYKDLDVNTEFSLEEISNIHDDVIYLACVLIDKYKESEVLIRQYKTKSKTGIYIVNLINTIEYDNAILKDQIDLYINYLFFFQDTQTTYLSKLNKKMVGFLNEIEEDIKFQNGDDETPVENTEVEPLNPVSSVDKSLADKSLSNPLKTDTLSANDLSTNTLSANDLKTNDLSANTLSANALSENDLSANALSANALSANALSANALSADPSSTESIGIEIVESLSEESKVDKRRGRRNIITKS